MFWTLFALLSLVVLGGFISYYGDLQGRRWGKKRVSWFGMRPKHTAILITSLTGASISLLSILTLLIVSPVMRDVILSGERAIRENKELSEKYSAAMGESKQQLIVAHAAQEKAQQDLEQLQARLQPLQRNVDVLSGHIAGLQRRETELKATLYQASRKLARANEQYRHAVRQNTDLSQQNYGLAKQNLALSRSNDRLDQANRSLLQTNVRLTGQNEELQAKQRSLTKTNQTLDVSNRDLIEANRVQLQASAEQLRAQSNELNTKKRDLALVTAQLEKARQDLNYAVDELEGTKRYFTLTYDQVRRGRLSVRSGGELARTVIDAHMSAGDVHAQLVKLLDEASRKAQTLGAARGQNGRAVVMVTQRVATEASEFAFSEDERLSGFTQALTETDRPTVVIVSAFTNAIEGEPVIVDVQTNAAVPMFDAGQQIASCRLNADLSDDQIKEAIAQFLQTDVRNAAVRAGAISQVDPVSGYNELGQLDPIDLGQLALRARQMRGNLILRAVAKTRITSADLLDHNHLRLEVARMVSSARVP